MLNPELAESYETGPDEFPVESAVAGAAGWSAAAGLVGDEELVRRAFTEHAVFAESLFEILLVGLGIPGAELPEDDDGGGDETVGDHVETDAEAASGSARS